MGRNPALFRRVFPVHVRRSCDDNRDRAVLQVEGQFLEVLLGNPDGAVFRHQDLDHERVLLGDRPGDRGQTPGGKPQVQRDHEGVPLPHTAADPGDDLEFLRQFSDLLHQRQESFSPPVDELSADLDQVEIGVNPEFLFRVGLTDEFAAHQ